MLIDFEQEVKERDFHITGILHCGGHLAEEAASYDRLGMKNVVWVEANSDNIPLIQQVVAPYGHDVIQALIADVSDEERVFHITNYQSMSSSLLEFGTHTQFSPDTIFVEHRTLQTSTIDRLMSLNPEMFAGINTLVADLQGAELLALKGATEFLKQVKYCYLEVNTAEVYLGAAQLDELNKFLGSEPVVVKMVPGQGWGDAIYVLDTR